MPADTMRLGCLPATFAAKNGRQFQLELLAAPAEDRLVQMYLDFRPRNSFQGLPPIRDEVCVKWVREMIRSGTNVIARDGLPVVGHTALFAIDDCRCEMLVVVAPTVQNLGLGTRLTECAVDLADELNYQKIWLPVDATNVRARHIYAKFGFQYVAQDAGRELDMCLDLTQRRASLPPIVPVPHYLSLIGADAVNPGSLGK